MKRVVLQNKKAWIEECPDPVAEGAWVVVKVHASPICGSDKNAYFSSDAVRTAGHEGTGVVVETAGSSLLKKGSRVILNPLSGCGTCDLCRTGNYIYCLSKPPFETHFAEYVRVQDFVCSPLPDDISFELGSLAGCALSPALNAIKRMRLGGFDTVLVTGLGPVGMGALTICALLGARVIAVDSIAFRKEMAAELGAEIVLDARDPDLGGKIKEAMNGLPLTKAIDTSGSGEAERTCIDAVGPGGTVAFIGENRGEIPVSPSRDFIRKGLTLLGAWHYNLNDAGDMLAILRRSPTVGRLITNVFRLEEAQAAFDTFVSGDACKVVFRP